MKRAIHLFLFAIFLPAAPSAALAFPAPYAENALSCQEDVLQCIDESVRIQVPESGGIEFRFGSNPLLETKQGGVRFYAPVYAPWFFAPPAKFIDGDYAVLGDTSLYVIDPHSDTVAVRLPPSEFYYGGRITVKVVAAGYVDVQRSGDDLIDGYASYWIEGHDSPPWDFATFAAVEGFGWVVVGN